MVYLKCTIVNNTGAIIYISDIIRQIIPKGRKIIFDVDPNATYREYRVNAGGGLGLLKQQCFSNEDFAEYSEIRIDLRKPENELAFTYTPRGIKLNDGAYIATKGTFSSKIQLASESSTDLTKLLERVRICHNQCDHLVQTYKEGMVKMKELHSKLVEDQGLMWSFYHNGRLTQVFNSLNSLEYTICDVKDLLRACTEEVERMALVVSSMLMPPDDQKDMGICSKFYLLAGELMWKFDLITHGLQPATAVKLEWCPTLRRFALNSSAEGSKNAVEEVKSAAMAPSDSIGANVRNRARMDREKLLSDFESGELIFALDNTTDPTTSWYEQPLVHLKKLIFWMTGGKKKKRHQSLLRNQQELDILRDSIVKRCKVEMHCNPILARKCRSLSVDLDCFRINHLDLNLDASRKLGSGTFKNTYEGEWCGQRVAIATIRDFDLEELKDEVNQLVGLQHPKVVSFYGWAYTEDAPPPIKTPEEVKNKLPCRGFYIVTEKMECDLHDLITEIRLGTSMQRDSGGPFSHSVGLDILLQIVEAMLHVHKHDVMHRDLKPKNFLVNSRTSAVPGMDQFYDVKLIDFGASKLFAEDKNTYDRGTTRYAAPETMKGKGTEGYHGKYDRSVDVFSFAMTCYQVITGVEPFRNAAPRKEILAGRRPAIPATILSGLKNLMEACWAEDPETRPTFEQIQEKLWTIKRDLAVPVPY